MTETPKYSVIKKQNEKDSPVHFRLIPARSLAAIRFSGFFRQDTIQKNKQRLGQWLEEQGIETEGDFIVAGYNRQPSSPLICFGWAW
jgi:DNA gyrase inhibitor GyrI